MVTAPQMICQEPANRKTRQNLLVGWLFELLLIYSVFIEPVPDKNSVRF